MKSPSLRSSLLLFLVFELLASCSCQGNGTNGNTSTPDTITTKDPLIITTLASNQENSTSPQDKTTPTPIPETTTPNITTPAPTTQPATKSTTVVPPDTTSTTPKPTTSSTPEPTSTPAPTPAPTSKPTKTTTTTPAPPVPCHHFDGPSFIGGIVLTLGLLAIGIVAYKFYKAHNERNYHIL